MSENLKVKPLPGVFRYPGSKKRMMKYLKQLIPDGEVYIEPYIGSAVVLLGLEKHRIEAINDYDNTIVTLFRVLQDEEKSKLLRYRLENTLYSRAEYVKAVEIFKSGNGTDIDIAWSTFVRHNQSMVGTGSHWSTSRVQNVTQRFTNRIGKIDLWRDRLSTVIVDNIDAIKFIEKWNKPNVVMYADPPYVSSTRTKRLYDEETDDDHHVKLIEVLLNFTGSAVVSGYEHPIYQPLCDSGWQLLKFDTISSMGYSVTNIRKPRTECVWRNPKAVELAPYDQEAMYGY